MVVSVGTPESGRTFCEALPFPAELLYLDDANQALYKALDLKSGFAAFFSKETAQGWRTKNTDGLKDVLAGYKMIKPLTLDSTKQMGGMYVLNGNQCIYSFQDPGPGIHAPSEDVLYAVLKNA
mmetsp:Transcript_4534/g.7708  ORF Transcript_4534/g.7708 Transcript_4534/m.7708 type:complete len:123 (-) Transcript_4534:576-944(-)|eukprot:CAMPEP_0119109448 /NCGR_PEP_ID=MMETSP1180-20130426/17916_1 /TAXON_ID=3052 ORGANISM="Chlamydomonas cf sp, Strain CCMP681" /NCGR_SAMPLE_ID=MMETSP1180 /ASSEMBLY_ACC=CAM_ASM_000741 /LENGTH=122 /DNA_ID=CAMNT_0007095205 /DNA_START=312 /DNA_END=683 /DNA_ORIENTATION=+